MVSSTPNFSLSSIKPVFNLLKPRAPYKANIERDKSYVSKLPVAIK